MITTVLFDLDGTLLPFEQDDFVKIYFSELCRKLAPMGYEPQHTVKSVSVSYTHLTLPTICSV